VLWSNPGEVVLTPFLGVGSEAYGSIINGRRAIGIELKESYFRQAVKNCESAAQGVAIEEPLLFAADEVEDMA
jgi:DNA modification methylase